MFGYLSQAGVELHHEMIQVYWVLLVPFVALILAIEILKDETPKIREIIRRVIFSILLIFTFHWVVDSIATVGDAVTGKINGLDKLSEILSGLAPSSANQESWFSLRETSIYIFSLAAYIVAYLGFFVATALTHFVWTILYACAPLMILAYVSPQTSFVTKSLYKGLIQVVLWKVLWSILGVLLLQLAQQPQVTGLEDYLTSIVVNLCIGVSMLFIPLATRSLISDGMNSVASSLALAPAIAAAGAIRVTTAKWATKAGVRAKEAAQFAVKPITNPITSRFDQVREQVKPRLDRIKQSYASIGLSKTDKSNPKR